MNHKLLLLFILISSSLRVISQELQPPVLGSDAIKLGNELYSDERYERAIKEFQKVGKWDTTYCKAQLRLSWTYYKTDKFEDLLVSATELSKSCGHLPDGKEFMGIALINLERYDEAVAVFDAAIEEWPFYPSFYANKANAYRLSKRPDLAFNTLKELLNFNPYNPQGHAELAELCVDNGLLVEACLAFNAAILFEMNGDRALRRIIRLESLLSGKAEISNISTPLDPNDNFKSIAQLVQSNAALSKKYKTPSKLKFPIVNQNHLIFEQLRKNKSKGFFSQFYADSYVQIMEDEQFANFSYALLFPSKNEEVIKVLKKKKEAVYSFWTDFKNSWYEKNNFADLGDKGPGEPVRLWFSDQLVFDGYGGDKELTKPYEVVLFNSNGRKYLSAEAEDGKLNGKCTYYYLEGPIYQEVTSKEGMLQGHSVEYYLNGNKKAEGSYKDDERVGNWKEYYADGSLFSEYSYSEGLVEGEIKEYGPGSFLQYKFFKESDIFNGPYEMYHANGQLLFDAKIESGLKAGLSKSYHPNGQLESEMNTVDGLAQGNFLRYHDNGEVETSGQYKDDLKTAEWKSYDRNGMLLSKLLYSKDLEDGPAEYYDPISGRLRYTILFSKGEMESIAVFNAQGKKEKEIWARKNKNEIDFPYIQEFKEIAGEGLFKKGKKQGSWMYYDGYSQLRMKAYFLNGLGEGKVERFYSNGEKAEEYTLKKDSINGWHLFYYPNKKLAMRMGKLGNQQCGTTYEYYPNDSLMAETTWRFDKMHGEQIMYYPNGNKEAVRIYEDGYLIKWINYGPDGELWFSDSTNTYTFTYQKKFKNGQVAIRLDYKNNVYDGDFSSFDSKGNLALSGKFVNNEKEGWWIKYYPNGVVEDSSFFKNGVLNGKRTSYSTNGAKTYQYYYDNGYMEKTFTRFTHKKRIGRITEMKSGLENGSSKLFSRGGDLQYEEFYKNGMLIGYTYEEAPGKMKDTLFLNLKDTLMVSYYPNKVKAASVPYKNGVYHGLVQYWYPNGKLEYEANYVNGEVEGSLNRFFESGKLSYECLYILGKKHGEEKIFNEAGKQIESYHYYFDELSGPFFIEPIVVNKDKIPGVKGTIHGEMIHIQ